MYATPIDSEVIQKIISQHGYDLDGFLGFGGFASAYKIVHRSYQMEFVLKVMNLKSLTGDMEVAQKQIKSYDCELNALKNLCHANIINIYDHFSSEEALFIVLEYCPGGSLDDLIQKKIPVKNMWRFSLPVVASFPSNLPIISIIRYSLAQYWYSDEVR